MTSKHNQAQKRVVINASAAKLGGARTIVESFVDWIAVHDKSNQFLLLSPIKPDSVPDNVEWKYTETGGVATLLFSCFTVFVQCIRFKGTHLISFNNINLLIPCCQRITYFHQAKVFTAKSLRFRIINWAIRRLKGTRVIVQSPLIKAQFLEHFGSKYDVEEKWPGVSIPSPDNSVGELTLAADRKNILWPVTDPGVPQKNLPWLEQNIEALTANGIKLWITAKPPENLKDAASTGYLDRAKLFQLYNQVDGVLIVSSEETLCLPIFEAASQQCPVFVLRRPYVESIDDWRGLPSNVQVFDTIEQLQLMLKNDAIKQRDDSAYFQPDWQIY